jgi:hypothetical protein
MGWIMQVERPIGRAGCLIVSLAPNGAEDTGQHASATQRCIDVNAEMLSN